MSDEIQIFDCAQGSDEWFACRAGVPSASNFAKILAKGRSGGDSVGRRKYMYKLVGERITGATEEGYSNGDMLRGQEQEQEACDLFELLTGKELAKVGFIKRGRAGASPDRLIEVKEQLEVKCCIASVQIERLEGPKELPSEYKAQVQGQLWISGREASWFISYSPRLPPFILRVERDPVYIAELARAVNDFADEVDALEARIRALMGA